MLYPYEVNKWKNIFLSKGQQKLCLDFFFLVVVVEREEKQEIFCCIVLLTFWLFI